MAELMIRMTTGKTISIAIAFLLSLLFGCSQDWTKAIQAGTISKAKFSEHVPLDINKKLLFVPVKIGGKQYRFLFDTGAPFSISNRLQDEFNFKIISKGKIVDSDHNRQKVNWAQVDDIQIGGVSFTNQTAFIGNFEANPLLKCLGIDGIVGANLLKNCNWTIDQERKALSFSNTSSGEDEYVVIPFKTDYQYNMFIDINIGHATITNVLIDFGSNGSVAVSSEIFKTLKDKSILTETFFERGLKQSGIVGKPIDFLREITLSDSVLIGGQKLENVTIVTGKTTSIGNGLLSRFEVIIDWHNKLLKLKKSSADLPIRTSLGFTLGSSAEKGIYVQSVKENSAAYASGIRPNMQVLKLDNLDFENGANFCDYVNHVSADSVFLMVLNAEGESENLYLKK